jgi:hypothetical protein
MAEYSKHSNWFLHNVYEFTPLSPWRRPPLPEKPSELIVDRMGSPAPLPSEPPPEPHLLESTRQSLLQRCGWISQTDESVSRLIQAHNARAQQQLAATNLRLQKWVVAFTIVVTLLALLQAYPVLVSIKESVQSALTSERPPTHVATPQP